jgi:hypothetical protein
VKSCDTVLNESELVHALALFSGCARPHPECSSRTSIHTCESTCGSPRSI